MGILPKVEDEAFVLTEGEPHAHDDRSSTERLGEEVLQVGEEHVIKRLLPVWHSQAEGNDFLKQGHQLEGEVGGKHMGQGTVLASVKAPDLHEGSGGGPNLGSKLVVLHCEKRSINARHLSLLMWPSAGAKSTGVAAAPGENL
jgi:hypothetical protein